MIRGSFNYLVVLLQDATGRTRNLPSEIQKCLKLHLDDSVRNFGGYDRRKWLFNMRSISIQREFGIQYLKSIQIGLNAGRVAKRPSQFH